MKIYVLFIIPINILLSVIPPPLPPKTKNYSGLPNYPRPISVINGKKGYLPSAHSKHYGLVTKGENNVLGNQLPGSYTVELYYSKVGSSSFYKCNGVTFLTRKEAEKYCNMLNRNKFWKFKNSRGYHKQTIRNHRKSLSRSNSGLTDRRNSIPGNDRFSRGRKHSPSRRHGVVFGSTDNLLFESNSISRSTGKLSGRSSSQGRRSSPSGRSRSSSSGRRSSSTGKSSSSESGKRSSSGSRSSLSKSLETLHISENSD